jgi:signal peptidase II
VNKKILTIATISLAIDQISKVIMDIFLNFNESIKVIPNFFYLTLVHNEGAAWGLFSNAKIVIAIGTIIALTIIYHFIY